MSGGTSPVERLRQYLREISPEACALLLRELERAALSGEQFPGLDLILDELRKEQRDSNQSHERLEAPDRRLFLPIEPFLVDEEIPEKITCRVVRSSLPRIWTWLERDLLPLETQVLLRETRATLTAGDTARTDRLIHDFQTQSLTAIEKVLAAIASDGKSRQKLVSQLGGERVLEALQEITSIFRVRGVLKEISSRLPAEIKNLADAELDSVRALFELPALKRQDVFPYALVLLFSRLAAPIHLLRLAVASVETDSAKRIAETPFAFAIDLVVDEAMRVSNRLARDMRANAIADICVGIKRFHDLARGLVSEINMSDDTRWAKRLSQLRADTAGLLRARIDGLPGQVRRLLRPHPKGEIARAPLSTPTRSPMSKPPSKCFASVACMRRNWRSAKLPCGSTRSWRLASIRRHRRSSIRCAIPRPRIALSGSPNWKRPSAFRAKYSDSAMPNCSRRPLKSRSIANAARRKADRRAPAQIRLQPDPYSRAAWRSMEYKVDGRGP
jgi:hypothetical protein